MNEKLKKIRDELNPYTPKSLSYYEIYNEAWSEAIPHIRQDEREKILKLLRSDTANGRCDDNWWECHSHFGEDYAEFLEEELKKMNEVENG